MKTLVAEYTEGGEVTTRWTDEVPGKTGPHNLREHYAPYADGVWPQPDNGWRYFWEDRTMTRYVVDVPDGVDLPDVLVAGGMDRETFTASPEDPLVTTRRDLVLKAMTAVWNARSAQQIEGSPEAHITALIQGALTTGALRDVRFEGPAWRCGCGALNAGEYSDGATCTGCRYESVPGDVAVGQFVVG